MMMNDLEKIFITEDIYICGGDSYSEYSKPNFFYKNLIFEIPTIDKWSDKILIDINSKEKNENNLEWFDEINEDFLTISNIETMRVIWNSLNSDNTYVEKFDKCCL